MKQLSIAMAVGLAFAASPALADNGDKVRVKLVGLEEVPSVSTPGHGRFDALINKAGTHIDWTLTYEDMQSDVTQAHIHIAQRSVNGGIVLWICRTNQANAPANTAACPGLRSGMVSGTWTAADVTPQLAQGIGPLELAEVIAMMRARRAYVNVHTVQTPTGEIRAQVKAQGGHDHDDDD